MIKFLQTTTLILIWCLVLSTIWCALIYVVQERFSYLQKFFLRRHDALIPALVAGPVFLVLAYKLLHWNLLFPVHFLASTSDLLSAAVMPAVVLLIASGLFSNMARHISREYTYWCTKPFAQLVVAFGQPLNRALRRLVLLKSFASSWAQSLPWLFGELIVVECVFNAPGLGLDLWRLARQRDLSGVLIDIGSMVLLYVALNLVNTSISKWVGKRLETYQ